MSQSKIYGIAPYELVPGPDFSAGKDSTGVWTGSQTFTCRKFDFLSIPIKTKLTTGTPANVLYPDLGSEWAFLTVASSRHEHQPGGITKVFVEYGGSGGEGPDINDETAFEESYSMSGSLSEASMLDHPHFSSVSQSEKDCITALLRGSGRRENDGANINVIDPYTGELIGTIDTDEAKLLYKLMTEGQDTYPAPAVEWTVQKTDYAGISSQNLDGLGKIASPPGGPPSFSGRNWMFSGASQTRASANVNAIKTWSKSYTLSPPGRPYNTTLFS